MSKEKNESPELLPCPFCGSEGFIGKWEMSSYWTVGCVKSCIKKDNWYKTREEAVVFWNSRGDSVVHGLKDHEISEMTNRIRDEVKVLCPTQQSLRGRISGSICEYLRDNNLKIDG